MKLVAVFCLFAFACGSAFAAEPQISYGPPGDSGTLPVRQDVCQYGYTDDFPGQGWSLYNGQQLGIVCGAPGAITAVGFYVEFVIIPGSLDIVIYDNGTEVSRTTVSPSIGNNEFDIDDVSISGDACIMLCPGSFDGVTGEDADSAPYGNSYFSNNCRCTNPYIDNNLTIWAVTGEPVPASDTSWGTIRTLYR